MCLTKGPLYVGGAGATYDANGNLLSGGNRTFTWTAENLPATVTSGGTRATDGPWSAQSASVAHQIGRADGDGWSANVAQDGVGFLQYGPYAVAGASGANVARWNLLIDNNSADNATVVQLDVNDATTGTVLASRMLTRRAWTAAGQDQEFALPFTLDSSRVGHALEYRVYWYDAAYVRVQQVRVTRMTGGVTESYTYDADGERVAKTVGGVTTVYFQGLWEQTVGGASTRYYTFNGQVVAMRDSATNAVTYLHGDHLGSVSLATNSSGAVVSRQDFDPWGKARGASTVVQTSLNYTGQHRVVVARMTRWQCAGVDHA